MVKVRKTIGILVVFLVILAVAVYINAQRKDGMAWRDGVFKGQSPRAEGEEYGTVELEIKDGKIIRVNYDEFSAGGAPKDESYPYQLALSAQRTLEKRLVETQDPKQVDNVSGATATWRKFKEASLAALEKAK